MESYLVSLAGIPYGLRQDIDNIEAVQRRAIRVCHGIHGTYEEKLKAVGLTTLCDRRQRGDMLETFKILNQIDDVDYHTWFSKVNENHQKTRQAVTISEDGTLQGTMNLKKPKAKLEIRKNFFSCRVVDSWNDLPDNVKNAEDVLQFKIRYDEHKDGN